MTTQDQPLAAPEFRTGHTGNPLSGWSPRRQRIPRQHAETQAPPRQTPQRPWPRPTLLSAAIAGLLLAPAALAATITVDTTADDGTSCTLREAIATINAGSNQGNGCVAQGDLGSDDTILFASSVTGTITLNGTQLAITKSVVIDGPGANQLAVDGDAKSRVIHISDSGTNVAIEGLTIRNGTVNGYGGGIGVDNASTLSLTDSSVTNNTATTDGGGIGASKASSVTLNNSGITGNSAARGGGIGANNSSVILTDSLVTDNTATNNGGGIGALNASSVILTSSSITHNSAAKGGGVGADNATVELIDSLVTGNSATNLTGGDGGYGPRLTNATGPDDFTVTFAGGGIGALNNASVTLTSTQVIGNSADEVGGGLGGEGGAFLILRGSTVAGNHAPGGAGIGTQEAIISLVSSTVSGNVAKGAGGIGAFEGALRLTSSVVSGNTADGAAGIGAVAASVTLTNSLVTANQAKYGAGGVAAMNATLTLDRSTVAGNTAGQGAGGIGAVCGSLALSNGFIDIATIDFDPTLPNDFTRCTPDGETQARVRLTNTTVSGNAAGAGGGGIGALDATVALTNSTVAGNQAPTGGGLGVAGGSIALTNSVIATSTGGDCVTVTGDAFPPPTLTASHTLIGDTGAKACGLTDGTAGNLIGYDPLLDILADYGCYTRVGNPNDPDSYQGCVLTQAPRLGSPVLNVANAGPATDERGASRPQGSAYDLGAFELGPAGPPTNVSGPGQAKVTVTSAGPGQARVTWTPPTHTGLSPLAFCTATAKPGGASCTAPAGTHECVITGLDPQRAYTVTVSCTNQSGIAGFPSTASAPFAPTEPPTPIPTLSTWGLLGSAGLLGLFGAWRQRRLARGGRPR